MTRLRLLLALAHLLLVAGVFGAYFDPASPLVFLIAVGAFVRWMVPGRAQEAVNPLGFFWRYGVSALLVSWLWPLGLSDLLEKAWADRLSPSPLIAIAGLALYLVAGDWRYFLGLGPKQVDDFYAPPR